MAKREQAGAAGTYLRRIAESEYAQDQVRDALTRLREAYRRGSREGGKAAEDEKLYEKIRQAATSLRRAIGAIEEPPPPPKRRAPKLLAIASAATAAVAAMRIRSSRAQAQPSR